MSPHRSSSTHRLLARRTRRAVLCGAGLLLSLACVLGHAAWTRDQRAAEGRPATSLLPSPSLVLSTRSRWLRHPLLSEPGAAFQDGPGFLDADPAGALQSPPRGLFRALARPEAP